MTDQFDGFQLEPGRIADDWVFSDDQIHMNRGPGDKISNYNYYFVGGRMDEDRTRTTFGSPDPNENPQTALGEGFGTDWGYVNYNPYGVSASGTFDGSNNFRVLNDYLVIITQGGRNVEFPEHDVMDENELAPDTTHTQYRNYPAEGYSSFGGKTGGTTPDGYYTVSGTRTFDGNTWVPTY